MFTTHFWVDFCQCTPPHLRSADTLRNQVDLPSTPTCPTSTLLHQYQMVFQTHQPQQGPLLWPPLSTMTTETTHRSRTDRGWVSYKTCFSEEEAKSSLNEMCEVSMLNGLQWISDGETFIQGKGQTGSSLIYSTRPRLLILLISSRTLVSVANLVRCRLTLCQHPHWRWYDIKGFWRVVRVCSEKVRWCGPLCYEH
jgi:hypothetical protein